MIDCMIVDDAPLAVDKLRNFISRVSSLCLVATFENGMEAFTYLQSNQVDLVFLDIQMEQFTGLQLLEALQSVLISLSYLLMGNMLYRDLNMMCPTTC